MTRPLRNGYSRLLALLILRTCDFMIEPHTATLKYRGVSIIAIDLDPRDRIGSAQAPSRDFEVTTKISLLGRFSGVYEMDAIIRRPWLMAYAMRYVPGAPAARRLIETTVCVSRTAARGSDPPDCDHLFSSLARAVAHVTPS